MATLVSPHEQERRSQMEYVRRHSQAEYQERLDPLHAFAAQANVAYFEGRLQPAHINLGRTAPRSVSHFLPTTEYGAPVQITLNEGIAFGTNRTWVCNTWPPAEGTGRFLEDLLLRELTRQYVLEVLREEDGYGGYGTHFATEANRIGAALGLEDVAVRNRSGQHPKQLAKYWPHCVRPEGYYRDDVTDDLLDLAAGTRTAGRQTPAPPSLGLLEYILQLLDVDRPARAREILARHVEWLRRFRERKEWVRSRLVEAGQLDIDGKTPLGTVDFDHEWMLWHGGTVRLIAEAAEEHRDYSVLPILADAMEDAGCADIRILRHLRAPLAHCKQCWVIRGILGHAL